MHQSQRAGHQRVGQLKVELLNLRSQHQALVDDGSTGERRHVEIFLALNLRRRNLVLRAPPHAIQQPLEVLLVQPVRFGYKKLLDIRLRGARLASNRVAVHRRIAPAQNLQALFLRNALKHALALQAVLPVHGKKAHGHAVLAGAGQLHAQLAALARKKHMGNLNQDARAVAGLRVAASRAAMRQIDKNLETLADDVVALFAADAGHQAHAAGVMFVERRVKTLRRGDAGLALQ